MNCRQSAFNLAIAGWLPCGALLGMVAVTLARDEAAMQERLLQKVDNPASDAALVLPTVTDSRA